MRTIGFTTLANAKMLNAYGQAGALSSPATLYVGLLTATTWQNSTSYTSGTSYVIPTTFGSISGQQGKIFKCTTSGTSAGSQPTWPTTEGGTVSDNTVVWTEVSLLFQAGTFTNAEVVGNNYARVGVTANSTNFPNASSAEPAVIQNGTAVTFNTPSADWGLAVGFIHSDASSAGNIWLWGAMTSALDCASGSTPSFGVNAMQLQMSAVLSA